MSQKCNSLLAEMPSGKTWVRGGCRALGSNDECGSDSLADGKKVFLFIAPQDIDTGKPK
jgi:hypothetical protein